MVLFTIIFHIFYKTNNIDLYFLAQVIKGRFYLLDTIISDIPITTYTCSQNCGIG